jgi:hypothetical protein
VNRTRARFSNRRNAYIVRIYGLAYPVGSGPVIPAGDVQIRIANAPDMTLPLTSLKRVGADPQRCSFRYRNENRDAMLSRFRIRNRLRRIEVRLGTITTPETGLPDGVAVGTRADFPIQIDVPATDVTYRFQTTVELVHRPTRERWRRPAVLGPR